MNTKTRKSHPVKAPKQVTELSESAMISRLEQWIEAQ